MPLLLASLVARDRMERVMAGVGLGRGLFFFSGLTVLSELLRVLLCELVGVLVTLSESCSVFSEMGVELTR